MRLHPSNQHYIAPVAEREAQSPGQHHGEPSLNGPNRATLLHEEFMEWLSTARPDDHLRHRKGEYIPKREWQELQAEWRTET